MHPMDELALLLQTEGYEAVREYRFSERGWRFDLALPDYNVAVEYEGIWAGQESGSGSGKSRHTTGAGYQEDCHKYNRAALDGWIVLRFTSADFSRRSQGYPLALTLHALKIRGGHHEPNALLEAVL